MEAIETMSCVSLEVNATRRVCIKPDLNEDYMSLFSPSVPINQFLIGGDTPKRLEKIEMQAKLYERLWFNKTHTKGSVTTRVVARTNLEAVAKDLRLSGKALHNVLFR